MRLTGFVLAGGKSTRMGRDKALLYWRGRTLLEHMIDLLSTVADSVHVVGRDPLPDRLPEHGPLSGIATALEASETDANLVAAVDLPLLTKDFLKHLRSRIEDSHHAILASKLGSYFPLCLGVRKGLLPDIQMRLSANQLSVRALIENSDAEIVTWPDPAIFRNINTPEEYRSLL
jgi:molybdopterin-guanine dinucleotide biosynthesis protein A